MKKIWAVILSAVFAFMPMDAFACYYSADSDTNCIDDQAVTLQDGEQPAEYNTTFDITADDDDVVTDSNAFFVGEKILVAGKKEKSVVAFGEKINVAKDAEIEDDLVAFGKDIVVHGKIDGNVVVIGENIVLEDAEINHDVVIIGAKIEFVGNVKITKDLNYNERAEIIGKPTEVGGEIVVHKDLSFELDFKTRVIVWLFVFASGLVIAIIFVFLARRFFDGIKEKAKGVEYNINALLVDFAKGAISVILVPISVAVLCVTVVGIPAALLVLCAYIVALLLSASVIAVYIGSKILREAHVILAAVLGLLIMALVALIPVVGPIVVLIACAAGFGMMVSAILKK